MLSLCLDNTTELELNQLAQHKGKPIDLFLKDIILEYLEDIHDAALGDAAMEELEQGKDTVISLDEWINQ
jgi:RHH-type rel operon transcriptional repressor/antitoxin RelB